MKPFVIIVSRLIWPFITISVYFIKLWSPVFGACDFFLVTFCFFIVFVTSLWGRGLRPLCLYPIEPSLPLQLLFPMPPLSHASQNSVLLPIQDKIFLSIIKKNIFLLLRISHNAFWLHLFWHLPKLLQDPPQYPPSFPTSDYLTIVRNPFYGLGNRG